MPTTHGTRSQSWESLGRRMSLAFIPEEFKVSVGNNLGMCRDNWYFGLD